MVVGIKELFVKGLGLVSRVKEVEHGIAQIGVSNACTMNPSCRHCPSDFYSPEWKGSIMDMETFISAIDGIDELNEWYEHGDRLIGRIHLSLWGDPFCNPDIFEMVALSKERGYFVSLTTDGMALTEENYEGFVQSGLDAVGISIGGPEKKVHELIRRGSDFDVVCENVRNLYSIKGVDRETPKIVISFLTTNNTVLYLPQMVEFACDLGADGLAATNLTYICKPEDLGDKAFSMNDRLEGIIRRTVKEAKKAKKKEMYLRLYPLCFEGRYGCSEDPLKSFVITPSGNVYPCTHLALPVRKIHRITESQECEIEFNGFGNIQRNSLVDIWCSEAYGGFRGKFEEAQASLRRKYKGVFGDGMDLFQIEEVSLMERVEKVKVPVLCNGCYKLYGF